MSSPRVELSTSGTSLDLFVVEKVDHLRARMLPGRSWVPELRVWRFPLTAEALRAVENRFPTVLVGARVREAIAARGAKLDAVRALKDDDTGLDDYSDMPIKAVPYKHQVRAFRVAMKLLAG